MSSYSDLRSGKALAQARVLDLVAAAPRSARPGDALALRVLRAFVSIPALCGYVYLALGVWLMLGLGFYEGDALSRTANAMYVLKGRDPHVAAIGFVWNPLPSIAQIPLVMALDPLGLVYLAGPVSTALFGVGSLVALDRILRMLEVGNVRRRLLLLAYGLHPLIVFYSANGMSESPLLFFMLLATHQFLKWTRRGGTQALMLFALASAGTFLVRYEGLAFAAGGVVALTVAFFVGKDLEPDRLEAILLTYLVPIAYVAALWVFFNAVFVGDPLYFYNSSYGNLAQTAGFRTGLQTYLSLVIGNIASSLSYSGVRWLVVMPVIAPVAIVAFLRGMFRREHVTFGVLAIAATLPAFHAYLVFSGTSFGWLRFFLYSIPFAIVMLPIVLAPLVGSRRLHAAAWTLALAATFAGWPAGLWAMAQPDLGREEWEITRHLIQPDAVQVPPSFRFTTEKRMAEYVDALPGKPVVLMDSAYAFGVNIFARDHTRYAITSDRDFKAILANPASGAITHILVPNPRSAEAVGQALPGIWQNGRPFAELEVDFGGLNGWRLYRVTAQP